MHIPSKDVKKNFYNIISKESEDIMEQVIQLILVIFMYLKLYHDDLGYKRFISIVEYFW